MKNRVRDISAAIFAGLMLCFVSAAEAQTALTLPTVGDGTVQAIAISGSTLYIGGSFTSVGGQTRNGAAAIDLNTMTVTDWNPDFFSGFLPVNVRSLKVSSDGSQVYAAGVFDKIGGSSGVSAPYLARVSASTGAADAGWVPNPNAFAGINYMAYHHDSVSDEDTIYVVGDFTTIGGASRSTYAGISGTDATATGFHPATFVNESSARGIAVSSDGSLVYVTSNGSGNWNGDSRQGFAALNAADGSTNEFNLDMNAGGQGNGMLVVGDTLYVGGSFSSIDGETRVGIAKFNGATLDETFQITSLMSGMNGGRVRQMSLLGGILYIVGEFDSIEGTTVDGFAAVDASTGALLSSWIPDISPDNAMLGIGARVTASGFGVFVASDSLTDPQALLSGFVAAVPEPGCAGAVVGLGCVLVASVRRRRG